MCWVRKRSFHFSHTSANTNERITWPSKRINIPHSSHAYNGILVREKNRYDWQRFHMTVSLWLDTEEKANLYEKAICWSALTSTWTMINARAHTHTLEIRNLWIPPTIRSISKQRKHKTDFILRLSARTCAHFSYPWNGPGTFRTLL